MTVSMIAEPDTSRVAWISAEAFCDLESSWALDRGSREDRWNLSDHSTEHPLLAGLPIHAIENSHGRIYITEIAAVVEGFSFTLMPGTPAKVRLYGRDGGTLVDVSDPSANTTALSTRHEIGGVLATPQIISADDKYTVEVTNPIASSGFGSAWRMWGVRVRYCRGVLNSDDGSNVPFP